MLTNTAAVSLHTKHTHVFSIVYSMITRNAEVVEDAYRSALPLPVLLLLLDSQLFDSFFLL